MCAPVFLLLSQYVHYSTIIRTFLCFITFLPYFCPIVLVYIIPIYSSQLSVFSTRQRFIGQIKSVFFIFLFY